ncbi:Craniofacial development protein 2 [Acanthosepion pharaonis]|uniref:Craniofacial development protein 2 n=1 Tax=Acanthosepion pharaonis TaxID=158019 RepID=A0A812DLU9_ACAPH|nr:Craniofacial development protein 2 [Sepia pharaonis]
MVRLKGAVINVTVISVYAPTLNAAEEDKDIFYRDLKAVVDRTTSTNLLVVAGDWNTRTGPADEGTRHVLGRFALGTRCDNGDRLVNFTVANRLVVTNTRFQHPRRHLVTWRSNDGRASNQFVYILVRARWASSVHDSRGRTVRVGTSQSVLSPPTKLIASTRN